MQEGRLEIRVDAGEGENFMQEAFRVLTKIVEEEAPNLIAREMTQEALDVLGVEARLGKKSASPADTSP